MAEIVRIRCAWGGSKVVGPGLSTFYISTTGSGLPASVRTFFEAVKTQIATGTTITVPNSGDLIDDATGELSGTWSEPSGGGVTTCTGTGSFSQGVGARIVWATSGINGGRRVRGATFIVPVVHAAYDTNGLLLSGATAVLDGAAAGLLSSQPTLRIFSPPKGVRPGKSSPVVGHSVPSAVSWLRSRRV